jgi:hypothetical protein
VFKEAIKTTELCKYTLAPLVEAVSHRKTGHIRPCVVVLLLVFVSLLFTAVLTTTAGALIGQCNAVFILCAL